MDDFINKVGWGLNLVFSNGVGWPRTDWLIKGGARREQLFKYYQRRHQVPTQVWYKAYPGLTLVDLERNTAHPRKAWSAPSDERCAGARLAEAAMSDATRAEVELDDIQGLVRFGYKHHTQACFLLLRVKDRDAARAWLAPGAGEQRRHARAAARDGAAGRADQRRAARAGRPGRRSSRASPPSSSPA